MGLFDGWNLHARTDDDQQNPADYRPDAGRHLTDDQYDRWLNGK
ncbi:MAG: hypothetical protein ACTHZ5_16020 [Micrococcaceae bacterium]